MYPLNAPAPYPREQWYVAGTGDEFGRQIVARRILNQPLVFYRTEMGEPVALWGLCPHRLMPFEMGSIQGDNVVCGYHGFAFAPQGNCISIPTASGISSACRVKSYKVVERGPFVWIWMGEGEPDHALLPDAGDIGLGEDASAWRVDVAPAISLHARAQLLIDNLLDLSHLAFVHARSVQGGEIALAPPETTEVEGRFAVTRSLRDIPVAGFEAFLMPDLEGRIWSELITEVYNPSLINAGGPWVWRTLPDGSRGDPIFKLNFVHAITPASPTETHYFGVVTRNFRLEDDQLSTMLVAQNNVVRSEDVTALEAIEKVVDQYGDAGREISIKPDEGAIIIRRRLRKMIEAEAVLSGL
jgi:vanillate O-demethylase monooxygenase subunit